MDLNVDVLVVANSPAALAAKNATQTIPIVMFAGDPVGLGRGRQPGATRRKRDWAQLFQC